MTTSSNISTSLSSSLQDLLSTSKDAASVFGLTLSSFRNRHDGINARFDHEATIAAIAILFFRTTVYSPLESHVLRYFFALLLAILCYFQTYDYNLILAVELFSYLAARILRSPSKLPRIPKQQQQQQGSAWRLVHVAISGVVSMVVSHLLLSGWVLKCLIAITPAMFWQCLYFLFPIAEVQESYDIAAAFVDSGKNGDGVAILNRQLCHLLFVTFHIQVGMGYIGIEFLRREQHRRNQLVRMDVLDNPNDENYAGNDNNDDDDDGNKENGSSDANRKAKDDDNNKAKKEEERQQQFRLKKSRRFQKSAGPFILYTALPYMARIILFGGMNRYAFLCVQHDLHRTVRLNELLDHDSHWIATASEPTSPEDYANAMDLVLATSYEFFNRKFFSLPKILLLPTVLSQQPWLVAQVLPFIFVSDYVKAAAVTFVTTHIENFQKQINQLTAIRSKIEAFDIKNAELLLRSGKEAGQFTQRQWERLTVKIQNRQVMSDLLTRSKGFFAFMQRNFVFGVLIDCALASLLAVGKISSTEIFVFSRAVEDTVDMMLTRSRAEAELARMATDQDKLRQLHQLWRQASEQRRLLPCHVVERHHHHSPAPHPLVLRNMHYTRGTASVRADHVELEQGIYALTGPNGSGKSTLFRVLMSCCTNEKPIDLPPSINMLTPAEPLTEEDDVLREVACEADYSEGASAVAAAAGRSKARQQDEDDDDEEEQEATANEDISAQECKVPQKPVPRISITMPSTCVLEISQNFYWPLYTRPIEFFYQSDDFGKLAPKVAKERALRVATELHSLEFFQPMTPSVNDANSTETSMGSKELEVASIQRIVDQLLEEKEDWFGELSGGQKSKAELVRKVFLRDSCPGVLLVDETMAPLDPASKSIVMKRLKSFCHESVVIVIYHADAGQEDDSGRDVMCVPSSGFFDRNLHLEHGLLHIRPTC